jgi:hypothetical protein
MFLTGLMIHRGFIIPHDEKLVAWFLVVLVVPAVPNRRLDPELRPVHPPATRLPQAKQQRAVNAAGWPIRGDQTHLPGMDEGTGVTHVPKRPWGAIRRADPLPDVATTNGLAERSANGYDEAASASPRFLTGRGG